MSNGASEVHHAFRVARDYLRTHREDYETAYRDFAWPEFDEFNWAIDWFDVVAHDPDNAERLALWIVEEDGRENRWTYPEMSGRSNQVANWLRRLGVRRGDRLILMLGNQSELWRTILAAMKLGVVLIPASTLLAAADLRDTSANVHLSSLPSSATIHSAGRLAVGSVAATTSNQSSAQLNSVRTGHSNSAAARR